MGKDRGRLEALEARLVAAEALVKRVAELEDLNAQLQERVDTLERQTETPLWEDEGKSFLSPKPILDRGASGVYNLTGDAKSTPVVVASDPAPEQPTIPEAEPVAAADVEEEEVVEEQAEVDDATLTRKTAAAAAEEEPAAAAAAAPAAAAVETGSSASAASAGAGLGDRVLSPGKMVRSASAYSDDGGDSDEEDDMVGSLRRPASKCSVRVNMSGNVKIPLKSFKRRGTGVASRATQKMVREHQTSYENFFKVESHLGDGCFGAVELVSHRRTGAKYAMKHINLDKVRGDSQVTMLLTHREIELMKKLDHPHVIKIDSVFRSADNLYVVMEFLSGGELQDKLDSMPPLPCPPPFPDSVPRMEVAYAKPLVKDMLSAISYLHANGIVHRDLKLENFIFSGPEAGEGKIKLIDFGLSRACLESEVMTADVGSVIYKAPEVTVGKYSEASDLWSLGVICHMLVTGIVPWEGNTRVEIEGSIQKEISDPTGFHGYLTWFYESMECGADCADFIIGLMTVDQEQRMTCATARQHAWMGGNFASRDRASRKSLRKEKLTPAVVGNLKKFREQSKLKRTALLAVSFTVSPDELKHLGEQFTEIDKDGDGLISREDFAALMAKQGVTSPEDIAACFDAVNQDGTGSIKYSEFVAAALEEATYTSDQQIEAAFQRLDTTGTGEIDTSDLRHMLGRRYSEATLGGMVSEADTTGSGKIDLAEFKTAIRGEAERMFSPSPPPSPK